MGGENHLRKPHTNVGVKRPAKRDNSQDQSPPRQKTSILPVNSISDGKKEKEQEKSQSLPPIFVGAHVFADMVSSPLLVPAVSLMLRWGNSRCKCVWSTVKTKSKGKIRL